MDWRQTQPARTTCAVGVPVCIILIAHGPCACIFNLTTFIMRRSYHIARHKRRCNFHVQQCSVVNEAPCCAPNGQNTAAPSTPCRTA